MNEGALQELQGEDGDETLTPKENSGQPQTLPSNTAPDIIQKRDLEYNQKMNEIVEWIETKVGLLKILGNDQGETDEANENEEDSLKAKSAELEETLEEIQKITSQESTENANGLSEEITKMLEMLHDTTLGLLGSINHSEKRCRSIKVLYTLILHLSASVGTKVTLEDIQKHINGRIVLDLYSEVQNTREPLYVKMENSKKNIEHGVRRTESIAKKTKTHKDHVDVFYSECSTSSDVRDMNEKLKELTKDSENFLINYSDSIGYLTTKIKNFFTLKQDLERPLATFMTTEIPDLYETQG